MTVTSCKTVLKDRTLWFDGDSTFESERVLELMKTYDIKYVDKLSREIIEYNQMVTKDDEMSIKSDIQPLTFSWNIADEYKDIDVVDYVSDKLISHNVGISEDEFNERAARVVDELIQYKKYNLFDVLSTTIYIIETFTKNNVVWGTGRGSSTASYVLYLIGLHDVDSYLYQLDIDDFLREYQKG